MSAHPTFPTASGKYHGIGTLSLLCSEWEEVGHVRIEHQQLKILSLPLNAYGKKVRTIRHQKTVVF